MAAHDLYQQSIQTIARFYHYLDASDYDALSTLLASDTVWHRQGQALTGPESIIAAVKHRDPSRQTSHQIANLFVAEDADHRHATATYYVNVYDNQGPNGTLQLKTIMKSQDGFELREGRWVLVSKQAKPLLKS